jgi:hypothetical protein
MMREVKRADRRTRKRMATVTTTPIGSSLEEFENRFTVRE